MSSSALCLFKDTNVSIQYIMVDLTSIFVKLPFQSCVLVSQIISDTCLHPLHHPACTLFSTSFVDRPLLFVWLTPGIYIHPPSLFLASSPLHLSHRHSQIIHLYIIYIFQMGQRGAADIWEEQKFQCLCHMSVCFSYENHWNVIIFPLLSVMGRPFAIFLIWVKIC